VLPSWKLCKASRKSQEVSVGKEAAYIRAIEVEVRLRLGGQQLHE